jgi:hypothetical protein
MCSGNGGGRLIVVVPARFCIVTTNNDIKGDDANRKEIV